MTDGRTDFRSNRVTKDAVWPHRLGTESYFFYKQCTQRPRCTRPAIPVPTFRALPTQNGLISHFSVIIIPSPGLQKILKTAFLKRPRMVQFYYICVIIIFTMVEENFENCLCQTSQNGSILLCVMIIFTIVEENFEIAFVKRPRMAQFYYICVIIIFTMVEDNFENFLC